MSESGPPAWEIGPFRQEDRAALEWMYRDFEPKRAAQGLPPEGHRLGTWLDDVIARGRHLVARVGNRIIGHVMLVPVDEQTLELANFVHQRWRGQGLGTALNRAAIELARNEGWQRIWLTVDPSNRPAIRSYARVGFRPLLTSPFAPELDMVLDLASASPDGRPVSA